MNGTGARVLLSAALVLGTVAGPAAAVEPARGKLDPEELLRGAKVEIERVVYEEPVTRYLAGQERTVSREVRFVVTAERKIPTSAIGPVLIVGERVVFHYAQPAKNVIVFTEYEPEKLPDRARILFRWGPPPQGKEGHETGWTFDREKLDVVRR